MALKIIKFYVNEITNYSSGFNSVTLELDKTEKSDVYLVSDENYSSSDRIKLTGLTKEAFNDFNPGDTYEVHLVKVSPKP